MVLQLQTLLQAHIGVPRQRIDAAAAHQLARCSIRFAGVEVNATGKSAGPTDLLGYFGDVDVLSKAGVDLALHRLSLCFLAGFGQVHHEHAGCRHVVKIEEFSLWCAAAPDGDTWCLVGLCFMKASDQGRNHLGIFLMVLVDELARVSVVCMNTSNLGSGHIDLIRLFGLKMSEQRSDHTDQVRDGCASPDGSVPAVARHEQWPIRPCPGGLRRRLWGQGSRIAAAEGIG